MDVDLTRTVGHTKHTTPIDMPSRAISDSFKRLKYYLFVTISLVGDKYKSKIELHTSTYLKNVTNHQFYSL
jgi:hypothetical protein